MNIGMRMITLILLGMIGVFFIVFSKLEDSLEYKNKLKYGHFWLLAFLCFAVKIVMASLYTGHESDMNCFYAWSEMLSRDGLGAFYESEAFTDYPPGYMYILGILGNLKSTFNIGIGIYYLILKLPAIICDIITGFLIYKTAGKKMSKGLSLTLSGVYMLLPSVVVNSSFWGQVDSIYTLGIVITLLLVSEKKLISSFFVFAVCVFIKPQSLIFTPVLLFSVAEYVFLPKFNGKRLTLVLCGGAASVFLMVLMALPFGLMNVLNQYMNTLSSYPYLTINAFNIWGAMGQNWTDITPYFSFLGTVFIVIITTLAARVFFSCKGKERYFNTAAFLIYSTFMFSVKMHDRYAFAAMAMLLFAFLYSNNKKIFVAFMLVSLMQFLNQAWVLFVYETDINYYADSPVLVISSIINILIYLYTAYILLNVNIIKTITKFPNERKSSCLTKTDFFVVGIITVIYSLTAFYSLGDMKAPETGIKMRTQDMVRLELNKVQYVDSVNMYIGPEAIEEDVYIDYFADGEWILKNTLKSGDAFYWNKYQDFVLADTVVITTDKKDFELFEVVLKGENGIIPVSCELKSITDEQYLCPERITNLNSTYFDEIYHARTAYEFIEGEDVYEWTHPPLGKVFIALGVKIFGMNAFGWRASGTVFGILMVFVIYVLLKRIFKNTFISTVGCIMFTFDFMHFTQTRIATIDVYVTFFIMLMYLFMYKYYTMDLKKASLKESFVPLISAGVSFGIGASCKWTACYACVGLALIFLLAVIRRYIADRESFWNWFLKTTAFCVLAFIIIPLLIYCLSYIPYMRAENDFSFTAIWENQKEMLKYHGETVVGSTHPFSSKWFTWPIMCRPIWYYSGEVTEGIKEGISAFGNPAVWWLGIPSFLICVYYAASRKDKKASFILIGYISNLLPWVFVTRTTYIYHYFPSVAFSVMMTCFALSKLDFKRRRIFGVGIAVLVIILFLMFYPVLSGVPVAVSYVEDVLRWFNTWIFI